MLTNESPRHVPIPFLACGDRVRVTERGRTRELGVLAVYREQGQHGEVFILGTAGKFSEVVRVRGNNLVITDGFPVTLERIA